MAHFTRQVSRLFAGTVISSAQFRKRRLDAGIVEVDAKFRVMRQRRRARRIVVEELHGHMFANFPPRLGDGLFWKKEFFHVVSFLPAFSLRMCSGVVPQQPPTIRAGHV